MNLKIFLTGGAGFIGSSVIRHIINNTKHSVVNIDKLTYAGNLESLSSIDTNQRYEFEQVDICNALEIKRLFEQYQPDVIMHLAAESHVDRSIDSPGDFIQTNIVGTYVLLEQARSYYSALSGDKKYKFRFHHVSTDEVFGDLRHPAEISTSEIKKESLFSENSSYDPSSPYSASKAASDHLVRSWFRTFGLPTLITNCSNNYGPYQFPEKLIPLVILNALENKTLPVYGKGNQIRDWLYVDDHAKALILVAEKGSIGETYNIGGHNEMENIEVVLTICDILNQLAPTSSKYEELITFVEDRPGHDLRYAIDANKIKRELGWEPIETFDSGMKKTIEWYLNNLEWCQHIQDGSYKRGRLGLKK